MQSWENEGIPKTRWREWFASTLCWRGCRHLYGFILCAVGHGSGARTWKAQRQGGLSCPLAFRGHRQVLGLSPKQAPHSPSLWQGCTASVMWGGGVDVAPPDNFDNGDCKMASLLNRTRAGYYLHYVKEARNMEKKSCCFFFSFYSCRKGKKKNTSLPKICLIYFVMHMALNWDFVWPETVFYCLKMTGSVGSYG